jgi:hypothetical protein
MLYGPLEDSAASARGAPPAAEAAPLPNTFGPRVAAMAPAPIALRASRRPMATLDCASFVIVDHFLSQAVVKLAADLR